MKMKCRGNWQHGLQLACLVASALGVLKASAAADDRPNFVFAIADDWGWPHAGVYGDQVVQTPAFDRLAREGVLCDRAFISSPSCTPSRGAIIAGQHFFRLDQAANLWSVWPTGRFAEFPALLAEAGYHVGSYRKGWGPGRGQPAGKPYRNIDAFFAARKPDQPFCLWFGASDPHRPYKAGTGVQSGMQLDKVQLFGHFPDVETIRSDVADYYYEVQRFDQDVQRLLGRLEAAGELDNTLIMMTGDHGMPFPRCKGNVYDCGARIPLAIRWGKIANRGRTVQDFISLVDVGPTFLEAAGIQPPEQMTGRSLLPLLMSDVSGQVDKTRDHVILGRERHVPGQEKPESGGYPMRAIRTADYLYIRNFEPDRWPAGTPHHQQAYIPGAWLADCDNGPTKTWIWEHRDEPRVRDKYALCFEKRPAEELYDLARDPDQLNNVAGNSEYTEIQRKLAERLQQRLRKLEDPRH